MEQLQVFINWTDEDFIWNWGGEPFTFKAKDKVEIQSHLAKHFAKHLADRECNSRNLPTDGPDKEKFMAMCLGDITTEATSKEKLMMRKSKKAEETVKEEPKEEPEDKPKKKAVKKEDKKVNKEFDDETD